MLRRLAHVAVAAFVFVPATLSAQTASYTYVGTGAGDCYGPLTLNAVGTPKIGSKTFGFQVDSSWWGGRAGWRYTFLLTGFSNRKYAGLTLPFDVSVLSSPMRRWQGLLHNSIELMQAVPFGHRRRTLVFIPVPIPNDRGLLALSFYQQLLSYSGGTSTCLFLNSLSRGGHGVIGN